MSHFILKEELLGEFRGNGSGGLDAAALLSSAFGVCCATRAGGHTKESAAELAHCQGMGFCFSSCQYH